MVIIGEGRSSVSCMLVWLPGWVVMLLMIQDTTLFRVYLNFDFPDLLRVPRVCAGFRR